MCEQCKGTMRWNRIKKKMECPICGYEEDQGVHISCDRIRCPRCGSYMEEY